MAQLVKNLPTVRETWVQSLGWDDPLEKEKATHSSILAWRIPWTKSDTIERLHFYCMALTSPPHLFLNQGFPLGKHRAFSNKMHLSNADPVGALGAHCGQVP